MSFLFEGRWIGRGLSAQTIPPNVQRRHRFPSLKPDYYLLIDLFVSRPNAQQMMVLKKKMHRAAPSSSSDSQRVAASPRGWTSTRALGKSEAEERGGRWNPVLAVWLRVQQRRRWQQQPGLRNF